MGAPLTSAPDQEDPTCTSKVLNPGAVNHAQPTPSKELSEAEAFYGIQLLHHHDTFDLGPNWKLEGRNLGTLLIQGILRNPLSQASHEFCLRNFEPE